MLVKEASGVHTCIQVTPVTYGCDAKDLIPLQKQECLRRKKNTRTFSNSASPMNPSVPPSTPIIVHTVHNCGYWWGIGSMNGDRGSVDEFIWGSKCVGNATVWKWLVCCHRESVLKMPESSLLKCYRYHWKHWAVMVATLLWLVAPQVVITTTCSATSNDKIGIMTTPGFQ